MPEIPNQSATVARVRAKYPTPLGAKHAACLLEIAREIGMGAGLLRKDGGTNIALPDDTRVAQDIICFPDGRIFDCLGDGEGAATPTWDDKGMVDPARYYKVSGVSPVPQPPPSTHKYEGGDNDTGQCDFILPNGETCNQPPDAPIHKASPPPSDTEPGPQPPPDADVLAWLKRIAADVAVIKGHFR